MIVAVAFKMNNITKWQYQSRHGAAIQGLDSGICYLYIVNTLMVPESGHDSEPSFHFDLPKYTKCITH